MRTVTTPASLGKPALEGVLRDDIKFTMTLAYDDELERVYLFYRWEPILYIRP